MKCHVRRDIDTRALGNLASSHHRFFRILSTRRSNGIIVPLLLIRGTFIQISLVRAGNSLAQTSALGSFADFTRGFRRHVGK